MVAFVPSFAISVSVPFVSALVSFGTVLFQLFSVVVQTQYMFILCFILCFIMLSYIM